MIKVCIFDQDGTLYPKENDLTNVLRKKTKQWISTKLGICREKVEELYRQLPNQYPNPFLGFLSLGLSPEDYHKEVFDKTDPESYLERDERLITLLKRITIPKIIVTFSSNNYSNKLKKAIGINDLIDKTFSAISYPPNYSKADAYIWISKKYDVNLSEICVIGDNYLTDTLPALEIGSNAILIGKEREINKHFFCIDSIYDLEERLREFK